MLGVMEDPDQGYAIAMEPVDRAVQCVNLEEKGQKLFKIAQNSEQNQANNLKEFNEELKGLKYLYVYKVIDILIILYLNSSCD